MESRQRRTTAAFRQVLDYLKAYPVTPEPPLLKRMRASLESSLHKIAQAAAAQYYNSKIGPATSTSVPLLARKLRRERMMPLVRIARPLLKFAPGADAIMHVPHARTDPTLVARHAEKMAAALKPHAKLLADAGYSRTFIAEFRDEARLLAQAARESEGWQQRRAKATATIADELKKGMVAITVIEGIVMRGFAGDSTRELNWRRARRVPSRVGRPPEKRQRRKSGQETFVPAPS